MLLPASPSLTVHQACDEANKAAMLGSNPTPKPYPYPYPQP